MRREVELRVDPRRVVPRLYVTIAVLSLMSLGGQILQHGFGVTAPGLNTWVRYTDVDREGNVPVWFQSAVLCTNVLLLWTAAGDSREREDGWARYWNVLALVFAYLSLDELTELHEQAIVPIQKLVGAGGLLYFAWIVVAVPLLVIFGLYYVKFLRSLPRRTLTGILVAGGLFVGGAVVLEAIGGSLYSGIGEDTVLYSLEAALEEALEMIGMTVMLSTMARHTRIIELPTGERARARAVQARALQPRVVHARR